MAFIGTKINSDASILFSNLDIPGEKEQLSNLHITLLCFEDNLKINDLAKIMEASYNVIKNTKSFIITSKEITCFPKRKDSPCPIIAKIDSKELKSLNRKLRSEFDKHNIKYSKTFDNFKPHITLSYADKEIKSFKIEPIEISIHSIELFGGNKDENDIFIKYPLQSVKNAQLLEKINTFSKIADLNTFYRFQPKGKDLFNHTSGLAYEKVNGVFAFEDPNKIFDTYSWNHMKKQINDYELITFIGELVDKPADSEGVVVKPKKILNKISLIDFINK